MFHRFLYVYQRVNEINGYPEGSIGIEWDVSGHVMLQHVTFCEAMVHWSCHELSIAMFNYEMLVIYSGKSPFCPLIHHYPILSQHRMAMADTPLLDT